MAEQSPPPPRYRAIQVDFLSDVPQAEAMSGFAINDKGEVAGPVWASVGAFVRGFVWLPNDAPEYALDRGTHFLNGFGHGGCGGQQPDTYYLVPTDINNNGRIVASREFWENQPGFGCVLSRYIHLWDLAEPVGLGQQPANYNLGSVSGLGFGVEFRVRINEQDVLGGTASVDLGGPGGTRPWRLDWGNNQPIEALPCDNEQICHGLDITDDGTIVGHRSISGGGCEPPTLCTFPCNPFGPVFWSNGLFVDMNSIGADAYPFAVNLEGHVIGQAHDPNLECFERAVFWPSISAFSVPVTLPQMPGHFEHQLSAYAVSNTLANGEIHVVGRNWWTDTAILWRASSNALGTEEDWEVFDLNDCLCDDGPFFELNVANDINDLGWITGAGRIPGIHIRAFVLVPVDTCPGDLNGDGVVGVADLLELLSKWGPCPNPSKCCTDLTRNGSVGVGDLLMLLANWGSCPGFAGTATVQSLQDVLVAIGLTQTDWDDFMDVLENGSEYERERYICWMDRYLTQCTNCRTCRGSDPFR